MFIIEGSDNLGKTTVCKKIVELFKNSEEWPVRYGHMSRPNAAFDFCADYLDLMSTFAVQDRFHIGGLVYHADDFDKDVKLQYVQGHLAIRGSVVVLLYAGDDQWYREHLETFKKDEMFDIDQMVNYNKEFTKLSMDFRVHTDFCKDVSGGNWVNETDINGWTQLWIERLKNIGGAP